MLAEPLLVVALVVEVLDRLSIEYVVGGSVASSVFGVPRATQDVDVVASVSLESIEPLVVLLEHAFFVDADSLRDAVRRRTSANIFHRATALKVDIFVPPRDAWIRSEMSRARVEQIGETDATVSVRFASPEDVLLHKLWWFKLGGEVSERQWRDVQGILMIQGNGLDQKYLDTWAVHLDVTFLLERARRDSADQSTVT
jgi:hypothetical protein